MILDPFIPYLLFALTTLSLVLMIVWRYRRAVRLERGRQEAINWGAYSWRRVGSSVHQQRSRMERYLLRHAYYLTGDEEEAKQLTDQTIRWMIVLILLGIGTGALLRSFVWTLVGASVSLWPLYRLKRRYFDARREFYRDLVTGGYIALPQMLKAGTSLEDGMIILARMGNGSFQRTIRDVCWLSGLPVRKNGQIVRLRANTLTLVEALEDAAQKSNSAALMRWVRRIKIALDKRVSVADALIEDGERFLEEQKRKRERLKGKATQRLFYIVDMGMPTLMTAYIMLELTGGMSYALSLIGKFMTGGGF